MREIPLSKGYVAIVDDEDYERLAQHRWIVQVTPKKNSVACYARRRVVEPDGRVRAEWMHRVVTDAPAGMQVDHIDRNGLNNTRANLRICTPSQNTANRRLRDWADYPSPYQGVVYLDPEIPRFKGMARRFKATIKHMGAMHYVGSFSTAEEAAKARDRAALHYFGEFAVLNFPDLLEEYKSDPYVPRVPRKNKQYRRKSSQTA